MAETLQTAAAVVSIATGAKSLLSKPPSAPEQPALPPVEQKPVAPTPDSAAVEAARRREVAAQRQRSGRVSTILTQTGGETLGA